MPSSSDATDPGRRDPQNPYNQTTQLHSEALWSESNHPNILGQLDPHPDRVLLKDEKVPYLEEDGKVVHDSKNKPIRDFPFLPRYLSSDLELFRFEAYRRMDPRLKYRDLWARMPSTTPELHGNSLRVRALRMDLTRKVRDRNNGRCWDAKGHKLPRGNLELVEKLTQEQIEHNTTWIVTSEGIRQPGQSPTSNPLPRNYFLAPGEVSHTLGPELQNARNELRRLQRIAEQKGRNSWEEVPEDHPYQWTMRRRKVVRAREAAQARSTHEAALTMLELASGRRDNSGDTKSKQDNAENTNRDPIINTACSVHGTESDPEVDGTGNQPVSIDADYLYDRSAEAEAQKDSTVDQHMSEEGDNMQEGGTTFYDDDTAQSVQGIEADPGDYSTEDEFMSDDSHEEGPEFDEAELRWVTRVIQSAEGTFSKS
jgi:hypothetical protein